VTTAVVASHRDLRESRSIPRGKVLAQRTVILKRFDERRAVAFERYLKSGSGVSFAQRHLR
jgi:hypothetical protein